MQVRAGDKYLKVTNIPGTESHVALVVMQDAPAPGHLPKTLVSMALQRAELAALMKEAGITG